MVAKYHKIALGNSPCRPDPLAGIGISISTLELSKRLGISQPTVSQLVKRGEKVVKEKELKVMG